MLLVEGWSLYHRLDAPGLLALLSPHVREDLLEERDAYLETEQPNPVETLLSELMRAVESWRRSQPGRGNRTYTQLTLASTNVSGAEDSPP